MMKVYKLFITIFLLIFLSSCANQLEALKKVGKEPELGRLEVPMEKENFVPVVWDKEETEKPRYSNSLWQPGSRDFFKDMRAKRVGDIIKVVVEINDKAELDNESERTRTSGDNSQAPSLFGIENKIMSFLPGKVNPASLLDLSTNSNAKGTGAIAREEVIETEIAAMVTQVLPNGNLVIHGDQEVRVNFEIRKLTVNGIVNPDDIGSDNSINSSQIAEAKISYGGRGHITNVQQPRVGSQIIDILSPF